MQESDYDSFAKLLDLTAQLYGKELSKDVIKLWWLALESYDLSAVRDGLSRHMQNPDTGQFMPKPADVVRMMGGTTQDGALLAWSKVDRAVRSVGTYESVVFDDPIIHAVLADMGGWVALGNKTDKDWPFVAREFESRYRGYKTRGRIENYPSILPGIAQLQNEVQNHPVKNPVLIGDKALALKTCHFGSTAKAVLWHRLDEALRVAANEPEHVAPQMHVSMLNG